MKEKLIAMGWVMYYVCITPCAKQHFSNTAFPGYEVRVRTKKNTFSILLNNIIIGGPFFSYLLEDKLKQFNIYET